MFIFEEQTFLAFWDDHLKELKSCYTSQIKNYIVKQSSAELFFTN